METELYEEMARQEQQHWWFLGRRAVIREVLKQHLPKGPLRLLDIGCGTGGMLPMLAEFGDVDGLENAPEALRLCERNFGGVARRVMKGSIPDDIPGAGEYDVATAFDVLEHLDDPVAAVRRVKAALKPGGVFVCAVPAFQFLWSEHDRAHHHRKRYTAELLRAELVAAGFQVEWSSYFNSLLFLPIAAVRTLGRLLPERPAAGGSDMDEVPPLLNRALWRLFAAERFLVPRFRLPVGVSVIAVARR